MWRGGYLFFFCKTKRFWWVFFCSAYKYTFWLYGLAPWVPAFSLPYLELRIINSSLLLPILWCFKFLIFSLSSDGLSISLELSIGQKVLHRCKIGKIYSCNYPQWGDGGIKTMLDPPDTIEGCQTDVHASLTGNVSSLGSLPNKGS